MMERSGMAHMKSAYIDLLVVDEKHKRSLVFAQMIEFQDLLHGHALAAIGRNAGLPIAAAFWMMVFTSALFRLECQ